MVERDGHPPGHQEGCERGAHQVLGRQGPPHWRNVFTAVHACDRLMLARAGACDRANMTLLGISQLDQPASQIYDFKTSYLLAGRAHASSDIEASGRARRRWGSYFRRAQACRATPGEAGKHRGRHL